MKYKENGCAVKYIHVFDKFILKPTKKETASNKGKAVPAIRPSPKLKLTEK